MKRVVLLLSGGLDSAANLVLGSVAGFEAAIALTVDYGQRGAAREAHSAEALCRRFGVEHRLFKLPGFSDLVGGQSALLGKGSVPSPESLDDPRVTTRSAAAVWVPNRNGVLISLAAALAEARGLEAVAVGFNAEEAVTFPDNSVEFMQAATRSLGYSTANHVEVVSATSGLDKRAIARRLAEVDFPFELLWSCYEGGERPCGRCESCQRLKRALEGVGEIS